MPDLNFKQGIKEDLPEKKVEGNIYYTLDEDTFYIDRKYDGIVERKQINANIANQLATVIVDDNITTDGVGKIYLDKDLEKAKQNPYTTITFTSDVSNNTPVNAVLFTEQILEDDEIAQVKRNLKIQDTDLSNYPTKSEMNIAITNAMSSIDLSAYSTTEQIKDLIDSAIDEAFDGIVRAEGVGF